MDFTLSEEQVLLKDMISGFLRDHYDFDKRREIIQSTSGWSHDIWQSLAEQLGLFGVMVPESLGGFGGAGVEATTIMEEIGRALVIEPIIENMVLGPSLLSDTGHDTLGDIMSGQARIALAWSEAEARFNPRHIKTSAKRQKDMWQLYGRKIVVTGAPLSTHFVVSARTSSDLHDKTGITLFLVAADAPGITRHDYRMIDDRWASDIEFENAELSEDAIIGEADQGYSLLSKALDAGCLASCADAVGAMQRALDDTVEYSQQRTQFGVPIGKFQVLQHRMVDMYMDLEMARSALIKGALSLDRDPTARALAVSAAKTVVGDAARKIGQESVQIHGAMGMTEELSIGHIFKRLTAFENLYGNRDYHTRRYADIRPAA